MKKSVKDAIGHFCSDFERIIKHGTKNDAWQTLEEIVRTCKKIKLEDQ